MIKDECCTSDDYTATALHTLRLQEKTLAIECRNMNDGQGVVIRVKNRRVRMTLVSRIGTGFSLSGRKSTAKQRRGEDSALQTLERCPGRRWIRRQEVLPWFSGSQSLSLIHNLEMKQDEMGKTYGILQALRGVYLVFHKSHNAPPGSLSQHSDSITTTTSHSLKLETLGDSSSICHLSDAQGYAQKNSV